MKRKEESTILAEEAFWAILASGKPPTVDLINERLAELGHGKRDRNVVNSVAKECWEKVGGRVRDSFALPGIPAETVGLFVKLREDLLAVARAELDADRVEMEGIARAQIETAQKELAAARSERDDALALRRETAAAFEALTAERDVLRSDLLAERQQTEAERHLTETERSRSARLEKDLEVLAARMESETARFAAERESAEAERKRQLLEIDALRVDLRATKDAEKSALAKLNDTVARERELTGRVAELVEQLGTAKGAERILSAQTGDLSREVERLRAELAAAAERSVRAADQIQRLEGEAVALRTSLDGRAAVTEDQLAAALAQAWLSGATNAPKTTRGDDPIPALTPRAERYAAAAMQVLGKATRK
ncbi:hypothetical protein [Burkholderia ubonensis]|uniref:hypothetical protein n=1 Tax=Burkholderia ubonensis TaxID=101571 RepID=UPI0007547C02|nr:hypothetical protein [Burkholderia ubonensis]KVV07364.1 hypothetical protein WK77_16375 [Burkholderia ubonensis]